MSPRPKNFRKVRGLPSACGFVPLYGRGLNTVILHLEEYETILLCDYEGMTQAEAAQQMNVSRPTVTRIYASARKKVAEALVHSCSLVIEGGTVYVDGEWFFCHECGLIFNCVEPNLKKTEMICLNCGGKCEGISEESIDFTKYDKMKKIALPTRNGQIDDHFGHCEFYTIVSVDEHDQIVLTETLPSPQGCGCKSNIASKLQEDGVTVMLAGNMGAGALNKLSASGIQVIRGCHGAVLDVVQAFLRGEIQDSGEGCQHHDESGHQCSHH